MGTTRIKVIDLSSDKQEIKTSRKHAEKLAGFAKIEKEQKKAQEQKGATSPHPLEEVARQVQITEEKTAGTEKKSASRVVKNSHPEPVTKKSAPPPPKTTDKQHLNHQGKK